MSFPQLKAIVYRSTATRPHTRTMLEALLEQAQGFNEKVGVTGVLLYRDGFFFQYIEGLENDLEAVYTRIKLSTGHTRIYELLNTEVQCREFAAWNMGFFEAQAGTLLQLSQADWLASSSHEQFTAAKSDGVLFLHSFVRGQRGA